LLEELRKAAELEGVALNKLINVAVAEKVSALRTEEYFRERGAGKSRRNPADSCKDRKERSPDGKGRTSSRVAEETRPESGEWERFSPEARTEEKGRS
jgi:hypothetical protein